MHSRVGVIPTAGPQRAFGLAFEGKDYICELHDNYKAKNYSKYTKEN